MNKTVKPVPTFFVIFGIVIALFVSLLFGSLLIVGGILWHFTVDNK